MLFLSFAGEDEEAAKALAAGWKKVGVDVWCSAVEGSIPDGTPYRDAMYDALARSVAFAVLLGDGAFDGGVKEETDWAIDRYNHDETFRVVPLRFDRKRVLPEPLKRFQAVQIVRDLEDQDARYFRELARRLGIATTASVRGEDAREIPKRTKPVAAMAAISALALALFVGSRTRWFGFVHAKSDPNPPAVVPGPVPRDDGPAHVRPGPSTDHPAQPGPQHDRADSPETHEPAPHAGNTSPAPRDDPASHASSTPPASHDDPASHANNTSPAPHDDPAARLAKMWSEASDRISADSRFRAWNHRLAPQVGLFPIGPDRRTRLEEFAVDDGGEVPRRDESGVFALDERSSLVMVLLPPGEFSMGSKDDAESPLHKVSFAAPFFLARTEAPAGVYERVMRKQLAQSGSRLLPATQVSWNDADEFARAVRLRLPSEAEWEYACRAGTTTPYWSGDQDGTLTRAGWTKANSGSAAHAVAEIGMSNDFGLFDTHGNVWEWCEDTWHANYSRAPTDGSAWVDSTSSERIVRGGSADKDAKAARSSYRNHRPIETRGLLLGFRPARSVAND